MADMNTFQWKWNATNGNDADRLRQIKAANEARIAQLEQELGELQHTERMTDDDLLDLELASNRARAFDFVNSGTAFDRIRTRREERYRDAREMFKADQTKKMENDLKISELQKQYRQELIGLANSANANEDATHRNNLTYLGERLKQLGGDIPSGYDEKNYRTRSDVMNDYWSSTVNTKTGRKFRDEVDDAKRNELIDGLRSHGEFEKADALQATKTSAEIDEDNAKMKARANKAKRAAAKVNADMVEAQKRYKAAQAAQNPEESAAALKAFNDAVERADSLARNEPNLIKRDGQSVKYVGKDY